MAYGQYRSITIDKTKIGGSDLTDYPILVSGTYSYLATVGNGGKVTSASGFDIQFYSDSGLTTALKFERDIWVAATGEVCFFVKIPTVSASVDTVFYMAYGNASVTTDQSDKTNVWAGYTNVYHFGDATTLSVTDSSSSAWDLTNAGSTAVAGPGNTSGGINFDGVNDNVVNASATTGSTIVVQFWNYVASGDQRNSALFFYGANNDSTTNRAGALVPWSDSTLYWDFGNATNGQGRVQTSYASYLSAWTHVALVYNASGNTHAIYLNGSLIQSHSNSSAATTITTLSIGNIVALGSPTYQKGKVDEFRVSNVARTTGWILADYNNQNSPSTFYTVGSEIGNGVSAADTLNNWGDAFSYYTPTLLPSDSMTLTESVRLGLGLKFTGENLAQPWTDVLAYNYLAPATPLSVVIVDKIIRNGSINGNNLALRDGLGFSVGPSGPVYVAVSDLGTYLDDLNLGIGYGIAVAD